METEYIDFASSRSYRTCSDEWKTAHDHDKSCRRSESSEEAPSVHLLRWVAPALLWSTFLSATDMSFVLAENSTIGTRCSLMGSGQPVYVTRVFVHQCGGLMQS